MKKPSNPANNSNNGARLLVQGLLRQGTDRVFCVPGESYLAVLDELRDTGIDTVVARHEGGAAMMAEADAKLTGRPGICFVTRGPGATNASAGVHVAQQDSTPLILFAGQVARSMRGRDAFQELDFPAFFGGMAKWVTEVKQADDLATVIPEAFRCALAGRPGPVVIALPEDMLTEATSLNAAAPTVEDPLVPDAAQLAELRERLMAAGRPVVLAGGSQWDAEGVAQLAHFAQSWQLPVACVFRRQQLFDNEHPHYAGDVGIGLNPKLQASIASADLLVLLGTRLSEVPSQGYTLIEDQPVIHIHPDEAELGRVYQPVLGIAAHPAQVLTALGPAAVTHRAEHVATVNENYRAWSGQPPAIPGAVQMGEIISWLRAELPDDAVICNGAGNYASWIHRFFRFRGLGTQLAPTSGSMGYGLPAAVAGKLRCPEREVICFAGDGCFQMTSQEFGTAMQVGAAVIVIVVDNGMYGTIRMHQERSYPERVYATSLKNPDFAALAQAYGGHGETVRTTAEFAPAFERARGAGLPALLHLFLAPEATTPTATLSDIRGS